MSLGKEQDLVSAFNEFFLLGPELRNSLDSLQDLLVFKSQHDHLVLEDGVLKDTVDPAAKHSPSVAKPRYRLLVVLGHDLVDKFGFNQFNLLQVDIRDGVHLAHVLEALCKLLGNHKLNRLIDVRLRDVGQRVQRAYLIYLVRRHDHTCDQNEFSTELLQILITLFLINPHKFRAYISEYHIDKIVSHELGVRYQVFELELE